ncbi:hypothetical protein [Sinanaerobacter chloroacetimidivorans]|uniref:Uncharacterized protein n=1 Tax=Sinanaerobacter chloroacetimidivorans TaxID=2818044 RepID=A0A8J8B169_9FIRM|nr:hypothetical protein [Sinanaerobacter chloroacetimidivorans]MBR0598388.1 hypothetical protein [Sinanaerobacter chloroacetimidivorans]
MKKLMRKSAIFLLVAIMLMSSVTLSFANTNQLGLFNRTLAMNIGLSISNETLNKDGSKSFTTYNEAADVTSYFTQTNQNNGDIIYKIVEGEKQDEVTIKQDGSLYLDGVPVTFTKVSNGETKTDMLDINQPNIIVPNAQQVHSSTNPPSGTTSQQFSDYRGLNSTVVSFGDKLITQLTIGALGIIIGAYGGMGVTIGVMVAGAIYASMVAMNPTANALSIKDYTYWHYNGFNCSPGTSAEKHFMYYYAYQNFTGLIDDSIYYRIWTY